MKGTDMSTDKSELPFTVIFYIDGDRAMETFSEHVTAADAADAFEKAKAKALADGGSSSGYTLHASDFENATEIATFEGFIFDAYISRRNRKEQQRLEEARKLQEAAQRLVHQEVPRGNLERTKA